jgi:DNA repair protein RecO (recombination protein O)
MSAEKTDAIVIRNIDFSETSSIVTFFTRDFGKVSTLAKGARRKKSPFESALDLLATCRIVFLHKSNDSLDLLTEAKLVNRLRASESELSRLYACYYFAELLQNLTDELDPHPELFDFTLQSLRMVEEPSVPFEPVVLRYELNILKETGQLPSLQQCVGCGQEIDSNARVTFGLLAGGVLCAGCRSGHRRLVSLRPEILDVLCQFSNPDFKDWRDDRSYQKCEKEIRPLINNYLVELLGKKLRLHGFISILGRN